MRFNNTYTPPHTRFEDLRADIVDILERWGYKVHWKVLDTRTQGVPQSRPRFYLVALLRPVAERRFAFPVELPPPDLLRFLDPPGAEAAAPFPCGAQANASLLAASEKLRPRKVDPAASPCVIDGGASTKWAHGMERCSPCLTASRCCQGGHYITTYKRMMTVHEMCRLQAIPPRRFDFEQAGVSKKDFLHAVGNAMSANVLARLFDRALYAAGLAQCLKEPHDGAFLQFLT